MICSSSLTRYFLYIFIQTVRICSQKSEISRNYRVSSLSVISVLLAAEWNLTVPIPIAFQSFYGTHVLWFLLGHIFPTEFAHHTQRNNAKSLVPVLLLLFFVCILNRLLAWKYRILFVFLYFCTLFFLALRPELFFSLALRPEHYPITSAAASRNFTQTSQVRICCSRDAAEVIITVNLNLQ